MDPNLCCFGSIRLFFPCSLKDPYGATLTLLYPSACDQSTSNSDIEIMVTSRPYIVVELTIHRGGEYQRREIFSGTCKSSSNLEDLDPGDDWEYEPHNQNAPISLQAAEEETSPAPSGACLM
jgi:hypothetical protein